MAVVRKLLLKRSVMSFRRAWHTLAQFRLVADGVARRVLLAGVLTCALPFAGCEHGGPHPEPPLGAMMMPPGNAPGTPTTGGPQGGGAANAGSGPSNRAGAGGSAAAGRPVTDPGGQGGQGGGYASEGSDCGTPDAGTADAGTPSDAGCDEDAGR